MSWVKYHVDYLRNWRKAAEAVARAAREIRHDAKVYVIGGAAEGRLTVESDVDLVVCIPSASREELSSLMKEIMRRAIDLHGLPWDYPIELHMCDERMCEEILKKYKYLDIN